MISQLITSEQIGLNQNPIYLLFKGTACMGNTENTPVQLFLNNSLFPIKGNFYLEWRFSPN